jgi:hypothetical protein
LSTPTRSMSMIFFGSPKAGKTTMLSTAPAPRLLIDVEKSSRFIEGIRPIFWNPKSPIPEYSPNDDVFGSTWDTVSVRQTKWEQWEKGVWPQLETGKHPFRSVLLDSISELQTCLIEGIAGEQQLTQQQWGTVLRKLTGMLRDMRDLTEHPVNPVEVVAASALEKSYTGVLKPLLQGAAVDVVPYLMDALFYLSRDSEGTRKLLTQATDYIAAGNRAEHVLPRVITDPTIPKILDTVFGKPTLTVVPAASAS